MAIIVGNNANNVFNGTAFADTIIGLGGVDSLRGFDGNDTLSGGTGGDFLFGGSGTDYLNGESGNDVLDGGLQRDFLFGGTGNDRFDYNIAADSAPGALNRDVILDFTGNGVAVGDVIDLSSIDANALLAGNQAFAVAQLTYVGGILSANIIGTAPAPDLQIDLLGAPLVIADIIL